MDEVLDRCAAILAAYAAVAPTEAMIATEAMADAIRSGDHEAILGTAKVIRLRTIAALN